MNWRNWIVVGVLFLTSCTKETSHADGATTVRIRGPIDWVERGIGDRLPPLSVTAELDLSGGDPSSPKATGVICRTQQGHHVAQYMIYEGRATESDWGVYGLADGKNGISMPLPFDSNSIRYEDRTARQALVEFLVLRGATEAEADEFLERATPRLFAEGLRVIFVLDEPRAPDIASQYLEGSERPFLLSIELEQLEY